MDGLHGGVGNDGIEVYNQLADGGLASLFFQELRERRGLAYSVKGSWERSQIPEDRDRFGFSLSCDPEKFDQAVTEALKLIRQPVFDAAAIAAFLATWQKRPIVSTLIADSAALQAGALEKLGKVERVEVEQLITP